MASSTPWQGGRTVVVDDNAAAATLLAGFLRLIGHDAEVLPITDRDTLAQEILQRQPDIAFLDVDLRGIDGRDLAAILRRHGCTAHLVAITGYGSAEDIASTRQAGFDEHWTKPLDVDRVERFMASPPRRG